MDEKPPTAYHKIPTVDIELAESNDESTAAATATEEQQQRKKKRRAAIKYGLKGFARCAIISLAFMGVLYIARDYYHTKWWNNCEAAGGHPVGVVKVNRTFFSPHCLRCEKLSDDARRY
jgi:hypothetical protein